LGAAVRRRRAEEALRESERLYRTVIEQVTENICLVDVETRFIVGANPAFQEALGYTQEELQSLTLYDIAAHDKESVDRNVQRALKEGRASIGQRKYQRKDGSLLDVEASGSLILRNGRETLCIVAHDITERARVQELLEERVALAVRALKALAVEHDLVVLALAQLPRHRASRPDPRPALDDLGALGAIKQNADVVLTIYREEMYRPGQGVEGATELILAKNRNGPTGFVDLYFYPRWLRFVDMLDAD
jgi:PAS domain S-box-containing protein